MRGSEAAASSDLKRFDPDFFLVLTACAILFGTVLWMTSAVDDAGWALAEVTAAALLLAPVLRRPRLELPERSLRLPFLCLALWAALSLAWSANLHATLTGLFKVFWIGLLALSILNQPEEWRKALPCACGCIAVMAATLILLGRPFSDPNLVGGFLALTAILLSHAGLAARGAQRAASWVCAALATAAVFWIGSLGPVLAWTAGILVLSAWRGGRPARWAAAIAVLLLAATFVPSGSNPLHRVWLRKQADPFAGERLRIWSDSLRYFKSHPLAGTGLGTYRDHYPEFKTLAGLRNAPYAHDEPLNLLCELGAVGWALMAWGLATFLRPFLIQRRPWRDWGAGAALAAGAGIQALFDFNLRHPANLALFTWAIVQAVPSQSLEWRGGLKRAAASAALVLFAWTAALPGLAELVFRSAWPDPARRVPAALAAVRLDPLNAFYRSQTGRMRDLLIALDLEPRNVWLRRQAAQLYFGEWRRTGSREWLEAARREYGVILGLAPGVEQFQKEAENLGRVGETGPGEIEEIEH